jgi:SagB-type dehydrogenase family enzyme
MDDLFEKPFSLAEFYHLNSHTTRHLDWQYHPEELLRRGLQKKGIKKYPGCPQVVLPKEGMMIEPDLVKCILSRRSIRQWTSEPATLQQLGAMLYLSAAITYEKSMPDGSIDYLRPAPSGGALYPIEIYPCVLRIEDLPMGLYHYNPVDHALDVLQVDEYFEQALFDTMIFPGFMEGSAVVFVMTAVFERSCFKYFDRGYRFIQLEAGHTAQNMCLVAQGLGLGSLCLGGYVEKDLEPLLWVDGRSESPIYAICVGHPR